MKRFIVLIILFSGISLPRKRIKKLLQSNSFRLSSLRSDIFGSSGLAIMHQLVHVGSISSQSLDRCLRVRARQKAGEISWVRARPNYEPPFSILVGLRQDTKFSAKPDLAYHAMILAVLAWGLIITARARYHLAG